LKEYILDGGGLVAGHDIIYRRTRNEWLSEAFGGQIRGWDRKAGPVPYQKSAAGANHPIGRRLPDQFSLEDGEVLFVSWNEGTEILFQEAGVDNPVHGLVMARTYETGRLVWLNSCDHGDRLASSIEKPSGEFVQLLSASVEWVAGSKQLAPGAPLIVAHRGVKDLGVENTMAAFRGAITLEADFIECDIRRTRDQVLVLHHDENLGAATISETSFSDLELAARAAALPLTRLEDLLEVAKGRIGLDLELKESGYEDQVVAMIRNHNISPESFVVTSFLEAAVVRFKECYGEAKCGLLLGDRSWWRDWYPVNRLRRSGVDFVAAKDRLVRMGFARRLASKGFPVWVWTVNDPLRMEKLLQMTGVEAVITDRVRMGKKAQRRARHE
jgi:glycerophosphoryl diester phosphodiesterase